MRGRSLTTARTMTPPFSPLIGLDADVVEEAGLPEVEEVALQRVGIVRLARITPR